MGIMIVAFSWLFSGFSMRKPEPLEMMPKMSLKLIAKMESKKT